ncbi:MAG TPA: glycosyltransferase [Chryseosolibacter sp.]
MQQPLVTVYITNYNYGNFIRQSIESVLHQTLTNFELIIIDDGSTDNSREIIEEYRKHEKINIIYQLNKGLNITNNIAMRAANGKYLMRLDADDYLEPNALQSMADVLERDPSLGLVFPDYYYVDREGRITGEERRHNFQKEVSLYDQPAHGACTMIRLEFLKELGGYNESFTCQDGYDLWIKFVMHHKVTNINQPLFSYRQHGHNLTSNEDRILATRQKIKETFVTDKFKLPSTVAIIPVRNTFIGKVNWPTYAVNNKSILQRKVELCLQTKGISKVVVSVADNDILHEINQWASAYPDLIVIERPKEFAFSNETLAKTVQQALDRLRELHLDFEALMTLSIEYPFLSPEVLDDAIHTLVIFKADSVLSVRSDTKMYYHHTGHSLEPILNHEKFTKLEREALYRGVGGIMLVTKEKFLETGNMVAGKVSHIMVNKKTEFAVTSQFDIEVVNALLK